LQKPLQKPLQTPMHTPVEKDLHDWDDDHARPEGKAGKLWRKVVAIIGSLVVIAAVFVLFLPKIASYNDVWDTISDMTPLELTALGVVALWNLISYQPVLMASLPGLNFGQSTIASQASTAVSNTVPAGAAFGIGFTATMYRSWGFGRRPVTLSLLIAGIWNNFTKLALPIVALALVVIDGNARGGVVAASMAGVVTLVVAIVLSAAILKSEDGAFAIGEWGSDRVNDVRRRLSKNQIGGFGHTLVKFRRETIELIKTRWIALTVTTFISHLSLFLVLLVALRNVGVSNEEVSWQEALAAFAFVRLLSAIPITPGGLGVIELGLSGGLAAAGGANAQVVAAVLLFRALTFFPPIPIGAVCYVIWRRQLRRSTSGDGSPSAAVASA
jgi:uncharacterized protein (TIRG00374 family)